MDKATGAWKSFNMVRRQKVPLECSPAHRALFRLIHRSILDPAARGTLTQHPVMGFWERASAFSGISQLWCSVELMLALVACKAADSSLWDGVRFKSRVSFPPWAPVFRNGIWDYTFPKNSLFVSLGEASAWFFRCGNMANLTMTSFSLYMRIRRTSS